MRCAGFSGLPSEWRHFDYPGWQSMPVMDIPFFEKLWCIGKWQ
ncbi:MAG: hypothetical protein WC421_06850 [Elusimicrobiales bacterium]